MGSEVGRRGRGLGMNVIAYDPYASAEKAAAMGEWQVLSRYPHGNFEDALRVADFFSLHMPLTPKPQSTRVQTVHTIQVSTW